MGRNNDKYASPFDKKSRVVGLVLTLACHLGIALICFVSAMKYEEPPIRQMEVLIDFEQEIQPVEEKPIEVKRGVEPRAKKADPDKEIRLVQKSEAQEVGSKETKGRETTMGDEGDVAKPEPKRAKPIEQRALFSSAQNKDSLAAQTADKVSDALKAGHPEGNTRIGNIDGAPSAKLEGRTVMGNLPIPSYTVQNEGQVVVRIMVDQYGKVINAIPGAKGTTVQDATLWEAAKKAALEAKFNVSSSAPAVQEGSITYIFKLK